MDKRVWRERKREVYEDALFSPSVFTCHKVTCCRFVFHLIKKVLLKPGEVAKLVYFVSKYRSHSTQENVHFRGLLCLRASVCFELSADQIV